MLTDRQPFRCGEGTQTFDDSFSSDLSKTSDINRILTTEMHASNHARHMIIVGTFLKPIDRCSNADT